MTKLGPEHHINPPGTMTPCPACDGLIHLDRAWFEENYNPDLAKSLDEAIDALYRKALGE